MKTKRNLFVFCAIAIITLALAACGSTNPTPEETVIQAAKLEGVSEASEDNITPSVLVADQEIINNRIIIANVVSDGPGWLVVHVQMEGKPGPILGMAAVAAGETLDLVVDIDPEIATDTLYAMLHTDSGKTGTFEFPDGPDTPVILDGNMVSPAFTIIKSEAESVGAIDPDYSEAPETVVFSSEDDDLGPFLTDSEGMTLYIFAKDVPGITNCYDQCAVNWPPLLLEEGQTPLAGEGISGELSTIERNDGTRQVAYNGWPLYYWINDATPGDLTGHGVGGVWAIAGLEPVVLSIIPGESQVTYEVGETFLSQDNRFAVAIGVTTQVEGFIMGDLGNPRSVVMGPITIDISQFKSDSDRRDNKIRSDFLESAQFPIATFKPTQIESLPASYSDGDQLNLQITGDLTIKETTQPTTFDVTVAFDGETMRGEAATTILMSDFGVGPISILGMLETENEVKLDFTFVAR